MSVFENIRKRGLKDIFSKRVFAYLESIKQKLFGVRMRKEDAIAYAEQIVFKRSMCRECYDRGACVHCGCSFEDLSLSTQATCSAGKWGKTMDSESWNRYKSEYLKGTDFGIVKSVKDE